MASQDSIIDFSSSHTKDSANGGSDATYADERACATPNYSTSSSELPTSQSRSKLKRSRSTISVEGNGDTDGNPADIEKSIADVIARRDQLRIRFKEWAESVETTAARIRSVTDNALVNQSTRLEQMLSDGKSRIDAIVSEQDKIRHQLSSFVAMLSSAQSQIFGDSTPKAASTSNRSPLPTLCEPASNSRNKTSGSTTRRFQRTRATVALK
ncbi:hypothetical protein H4R20_004479 [Coemansia guatemalensis]|uniref:Uncharacterized protein n=1 Tax=Coemansia guatemalensis TaxID=2761395 RepID=A0A9W8LSR1_9FUNG|nr:hypothetical protein H4R20_004479 [Coemansia guatemalensis]